MSQFVGESVPSGSAAPSEHAAGPDLQPPIPPEAFPVKAIPPEVTEALDHISKRDTLDTYRRRLNGTSALATRATTFIGIPVTGTALMSGAELTPRFLAGGTASAVAGIVVSSVVYGVQRGREKGRAAKRNEAQHVIREHLDEEPTDIIRHKGRGKKHTLRWYGADSHYGGDQDPALGNRLAKIIDFAEANNMHSVVTSANVLGSGKTAEALAEQYKDNLTTTKELFVKTKGVRITDTQADEKLLRLSVQQARELAKKIETDGKIMTIEALAEWLLVCAPDHPVAEAYTAWQAHGQSPELKPNIIKRMHESVGRRLQNETFGDSIRVPIIDEATGQHLVHVNESLNTTVILSPKGIQNLSNSLPQEDGSRLSAVTESSFSSMVGEDIDLFSYELAKQCSKKLKNLKKFPAPKPDKEKSDEEIKQLAMIAQEDTDTLELCLYYLLNNPSKYVEGRRVRSINKDNGWPPNSKTLYDRLPEESPRSRITWLHSRGKVPKDEQTIEYNRMTWRGIGKKVGATALAAVIGFGIGYGWEEAHTPAELWNTFCNPTHYPQGMSQENKADCDNKYYPWFPIADKSASAVYEVNNTLEDQSLLKAYELGIITPENIESLAGSVSKEWAAQKKGDLLKRFNLYGNSQANVGDVELGEDNPALWSLEPLNGADTAGYWATNVQSNMVASPEKNYDSPPLPPFTEGSIRFDARTNIKQILPIGTPVPKNKEDIVQFIRELDVPRAPIDTGQPLINVSGRMLVEGGSLVDYGPNPNMQNRWRSYALPVLGGADIVAAQIVVKDLATDRVTSTPDALIYQESNGTFAFRLPYHSDKENLDKDYLDITYTIAPEATSDLPLRAEHPMTAQKVGIFPAPLDEVLTPNDVKSIADHLHLSPDATASQIATAIKNSRDYSFTPYADSPPLHKPSIETRDPHTTVKDMLVGAAEYATDMENASCNSSTLMEMVASRGKDGDAFLNAVTGFGNQEGALTLSQSSSHVWTIRSDSEKIDPTPGRRPGSANEKAPPPAPYEASPAARPDMLKAVILGATGITALGLGFPAGTTTIPPLLAYGRRRPYTKALAQIQKRERVDNSLVHADIDLVNSVLYAPEHARIQSTVAALPLTPASQISAVERLRTLPHEHLVEFEARLTARMEHGGLTMSDATQRRIHDLVKAAYKLHEQQTRENAALLATKEEK